MLKPNVPLAWFVHLITASGAAVGFMALLSIVAGDFKTALVWMALAFLIDGIDGPLARQFKITETLPHISGEILDYIIDFFTYIIIPAYLIYAANILPESVELIVVLAIIITGQYWFAVTSQKTSDNYFNGFPGVWNIMAFYLLVWNFSPVVNLIIVGALIILTFVPIKVLHPVRVKWLQPLTITICLVWAISSCWVIWSFDNPNRLMAAISTGCLLYLIVIGMVRTFVGKMQS